MLWWEYPDSLTTLETYDGLPVLMTWKDHLGFPWAAYYYSHDHLEGSITYLVKSTTFLRLAEYLSGDVLCIDFITESNSGFVYQVSYLDGYVRKPTRVRVETLAEAEAKALPYLPDPNTYHTHYDDNDHEE